MLHSLLAVLLMGGIGTSSVGSKGKPVPDDAVTTTYLPSAFPNLAPKALDRYAVVEMNTSARTPSVLLGVFDVEGDPLTVASFTQPAHGSALLNKDATFAYTPHKDFVGNDRFQFTLSDGRGGLSRATMHIQVIKTSGKWSTTSFTNLAEVTAAGKAIIFGNSATVPRTCDWDGDGKIDLLVGTGGTVWWYRNIGKPTVPLFAPGAQLKARGKDLKFGQGRVSISIVDMDNDGKQDLVIVPDDRKVRWLRNIAEDKGEPVLAEPVILQTRSGADFVAEDIRADVADWNGDGLPDIITGSRSGAVKVAYNVGKPGRPVFAEPVLAVDSEARKIEGSYNLNVRIVDLNQDGIPDLVDSYNWGNIHFRINAGSAAKPRLPDSGTFNVSGPGYARVDMHSLSDGPIVDFADLDGDGTIDLIVGGEVHGKVHIAFGQSGRSYLQEIEALIAAHPNDLGTFLEDPANSLLKNRMQVLQGSLYDYITSFATPGQKSAIARGLVKLITAYPQYFKHQTFDLKKQPGLPSLAVQTWLSLLLTGYHDPATRKELAEAAQLPGAYRKLVEEIGLIYAENGQNPRGAEAIYQWVRTIPREVYPDTCITAKDWLGFRGYLVRGVMKNTFNGFPVDGGEYGFGKDARAVIGDRGSENWFMTVVHHEACHSLDAYVRQFPDLNRRWGQTLVLAGGPDMRADPKTGWLSMDLTKQHFREAKLWDGDPAIWQAAWKKYWSVPPGSGWHDFGFMRGNTEWFYAAPQESLATQGNQFWNSTEGRIQVALDRWQRGYKSNLTEVLFFLDIWSVGLNKIKFYENDNACRQIISFAQLRRNPQGYIDRIDLGDRYYEFTVDAQGVVTGIVHTPSPSSK